MAPESVCMDCGGLNPVWFAPNDVWNLVIGGPEAKDDPGGFYCPVCFIRRAEAAGIKPTAWELKPEGCDWRSIETPPPAGQRVLAWWPHLGQVVVAWIAQGGRHFGTWTFSSLPSVTHTPRIGPTLWKPLDPPPAIVDTHPKDGKPA